MEIGPKGEGGELANTKIFDTETYYLINFLIDKLADILKQFK